MSEQLADYPTNHVLAIAPDGGTADRCHDAVQSVDPRHLDIEVVRPDESDEATTSATDAPIEAVRTGLRQLLGGETEDLKRYAAALREGRCVLYVSLPDPDDVGESDHDDIKRRVGQALTDQGAGEVTYFGKWQVEELGQRGTAGS